MEKELLFSITVKDFDIQYFCAGGHGGQNMQKNATACRMVHRESGATGISRDDRSQLQNKKKAFKRCVESKDFQKWLKLKISRELGKEIDIEEQVRRDMESKNLLIEKMENGKWVKE